MEQKSKSYIIGTIAVIALLFLTLTTCERLKEDPLYVGSWQYKDKLYFGDITYNISRTLILTKTTYEEIYAMQRDNSGTITALLALKGDLIVSGSEFTFMLTAVGECIKDASQNCTSAVQWYAKGSATYNTYIQYLKETINGEYEANEDYLWLVRDSNIDGDTEDDGEDIEYERP
jgi:hypothetical protein